LLLKRQRPLSLPKTSSAKKHDIPSADFAPSAGPNSKEPRFVPAMTIAPRFG
jgi:hypothetical protein